MKLDFNTPSCQIFDKDEKSSVVGCAKAQVRRGDQMRKTTFGMFLVAGVLSAIGGTFDLSAQTASQESFAPDNDLWMEDSLMGDSGISKETFDKVIAISLELYAPVAKSRNETIRINALWDKADVNANVTRKNGGVYVNMYGGLARRAEVTPEGFALVLCHELGHAYGGTPYLVPGRFLSAEGQADYYGADACLSQVLPMLESSFDVTRDFGYSTKQCTENFANATERALCIRKLEGAKGIGKLLGAMSEEAEPSFETPDPTKVNVTELSYPATVQCRLDTYRAGTFAAPRPACWFYK